MRDSVPPAGVRSAPTWAAEFARLYPALRRFAGAVGAPGLDPDDLVQEACVRFLRRAVDEPVTDLAAYMRRTVLNLAITRRASGARQSRLEPLLVVEEVVGTTYPSDLADLDLLDPIDRALLYLTAVERWTFSEAAVLLDRPEAALRMRASRARRQLRAALERSTDG